nr:hypothetical protein [Tanacetum cinerariifolium]
MNFIQSQTLKLPTQGRYSESDEEDDDKETRDEESFDPIPHTPESSEDDGNDEEDQGLKNGEEERLNKEEEADELYRDVNINQGRGIQLSQEIKDSHVTLTPVNPDGQQESSSVSSQFMTSMLNPTSDASVESIFVTASTSIAPLPTPTPTMTPSIIASITTASQAPIPPMTFPSDIIQHLLSFGSLFHFDDRLKALEANFSEFSQTNPFAEAVFAILGIVHQYMNQQMNEAVRVAVQLQTDQLRDASQRENDEFLRTIDENMKKIIKEQVKSQVNEQVSRSYQELNNEQRNLYKALVEAYEADKIILDTYGETVTLKRRRDDEANKDEGPSVGSDRGSKDREKASASESAFAEEPVQTVSQMDEPSHPVFDTELTNGSCKSLIELEYHLEEAYKAIMDQLDWVNPEGQQYPHNLLQPLSLIPDNRGRRVIPFSHFINNDLEFLRGGDSSRKYTTSVMKTKAADYGYIKWIEVLFYGFTVNWESARDVYSKRRIIALTELKIVEWHSYRHLDWITVHRDNDMLYKFKEGNFKRLRLQDIEDMLLLLVQGKLSNLTIEERFTFNISFRMFTRSIVIQRRVEDLQLGVESYQKRLNLIKPDTYRSDLKRREAYTAYSNLRGFIYQNKDKKNRLMWIDELHKFSDGMLNDVCTALDDRLKGIKIWYMPHIIWRKSDKDRATAMIQAIDKMLKTRMIMRSLEKFVGGRLYEGDF